MAISIAWTDIAAGQVDADSPLNQLLFESIRDDLYHLKYWLGKNYTADDDHTHNGVDSAIAHTPVYTSGTRWEFPGQVKLSGTGTNTSYVKEGEWAPCVRDGTVATKITVDTDGAQGFGRIYVNDIAVGTERESTGSLATFYEDIDVVEGDIISLYGKRGSSGTYTVELWMGIDNPILMSDVAWVP